MDQLLVCTQDGGRVITSDQGYWQNQLPSNLHCCKVLIDWYNGFKFMTLCHSWPNRHATLITLVSCPWSISLVWPIQGNFLREGGCPTQCHVYMVKCGVEHLLACPTGGQVGYLLSCLWQGVVQTTQCRVLREVVGWATQCHITWEVFSSSQ